MQVVIQAVAWRWQNRFLIRLVQAHPRYVRLPHGATLLLWGIPTCFWISSSIRHGTWPSCRRHRLQNPSVRSPWPDQRAWEKVKGKAQLICSRRPPSLPKQRYPRVCRACQRLACGRIMRRSRMDTEPGVSPAFFVGSTWRPSCKRISSTRPRMLEPLFFSLIIDFANWISGCGHLASAHELLRPLGNASP